MNQEKILIAFFSRNGENYVNGDMVDLEVGNTEVMAKKIGDAVGGDLFKIEPVVAYPFGYSETTKVGARELAENARPKLLGKLKNMDEYDTVFIGYPNWWGTFPMPVFTFLESYDFSGKCLIPFCTHEGSGFGKSVSDLKNKVANATILDGLAVRGSVVEGSDKAILGWLKRLKDLKILD